MGESPADICGPDAPYAGMQAMIIPIPRPAIVRKHTAELPRKVV